MIKIAIIDVFGKKVGSVKLESKNDMTAYLDDSVLVIDINNFQTILRASRDGNDIIHFFEDLKDKVEKMKRRLKGGEYLDKDVDDIVIDLYNDLDELNNDYQSKGFKIIDPEEN